MSTADSQPTELRPGLDYYVEAGRFVFTAEYLARRGWCCGNGCRHCPYEGEQKCSASDAKRRSA